MKKFTLLALAALGLGALLGSCQKEDEPENLVQPAPYFPNAVGDEWTYATFDSLRQQAGTLTVRITGTTTLSTGQPATVWLYTQPTRVDTEYVAVRHDTVAVYPHRRVGRFDQQLRYVLPWRVGARWQGPNLDGTTEVRSQGSLTTPAGTFAQTYFQQRAAGCCNYVLRVASWVAPGVGLAKRGRYERDLSPPLDRSSWTLTSYRVSTP